MPLNFDMTGVSSAGKPLPEGEYEFEIEDAVCKLSAKKDSYNMKIRLTVVSDAENGRTHSENLNVQEKTLPFIKAFLTKLWNCEDEDITSLDIDIDESDGTVRSINDREIVGSHIGGIIKHVPGDGGAVFGNIVAWITV